MSESVPDFIGKVETQHNFWTGDLYVRLADLAFYMESEAIACDSERFQRMARTLIRVARENHLWNPQVSPSPTE